MNVHTSDRLQRIENLKYPCLYPAQWQQAQRDSDLEAFAAAVAVSANTYEASYTQQTAESFILGVITLPWCCVAMQRLYELEL